MPLKKSIRKKVYLNGSLVFEDRASVPVFDRGLLYGDGLFETMKAAHGVVAFKDAHIKRLKKGARLLGIPAKAINLKGFFDDVKNNALERLLEANRLHNGTAYLRITVTRGQDPGNYGRTTCSAPTVLVTTRPLDAKQITAQQRRGIKAVFIKGYCPSIPWIKTLNYLPNVLGKAEAARKGASEGIFVDHDGCVTEGTSTNVFIVTDGIIKTPPVYEGTPGRGVLPGIIRQAVILAARKLGLTVKESAILPTDLLSADEVFLTNSAVDIVPLVRVGAKIIGNNKPGKVTRALQKACGLDI